MKFEGFQGCGRSNEDYFFRVGEDQCGEEEDGKEG